MDGQDGQDQDLTTKGTKGHEGKTGDYPAKCAKEVTVVPDHAVSVVPKWELPEAPSWEKAREYYRAGAEAIIRLGCEIFALRAEFFAQGVGGGFEKGTLRRTPAARCLKDADSNNLQKVKNNEAGWQVMVRQELGISDDTARRLMQRAQYVGMLSDLSQGQSVEFYDSKKNAQTIPSTPENAELAKRTLDDVLSGNVSATRAWAGIIGEGSRRKAGSARADVNHYRNIEAALIKLSTSLPHWRSITPDQRAHLENMFSMVSKHFPATWSIDEE